MFAGLRRPGPGETAYRDAAAALAQVVAIEAIRLVAERNPGRRIGPSNLSAEARMAERFGRIGLPETAKPRGGGDFARTAGESGIFETVWRSELDSNSQATS